ncbi:MAG: methyltransferase [Acidobacteriaceae bacterium]|nr:methyltransferase [Acidobacteriaceae bacterium]
MTETSISPPLKILRSFAAQVATKFALPVQFSPEDQLKGPTEELSKSLGALLKKAVDVVTEVHLSDVSGRPDMGVTVDHLLAGHIELKAPGKGADPKKFKGANKNQWTKFQDLPNLIYTDGNEWTLFRNGQRIGAMVRLSGDITEDGAKGVVEKDAEALSKLFYDFLSWHPIVPSTPKALAELLAPLCRLLKSDVLAAVQDPMSDLSTLAKDWRTYLFPDADDKQFADAYAQTLTYALLLARFSGASDVTTDGAAKAIKAGHRLLSDALKILTVDEARNAIEVPVSLLERVMAEIDVAKLTSKSKGDLWLYFYEDFLAAYDIKMRKDRGVYYTPVEVVQAQVHLIDELLTGKFLAEHSFVDEKVVTLDPACGTGTYILAALRFALNKVENAKGPGMRVSAASTAASNLHAFELLVGPYSVAHLRLTQQLSSEKAAIPEDGVHVYLADTLESPHALPPKHLPLTYKNLGEEHKRAQKIKSGTPVLVCLGNPPYDRQEIEDDDTSLERRKGGWVRFGDTGVDGTGILQDFIVPLSEIDAGLHAKNLYNDYVYFWRWALWKVFETLSPRGIVSFITASSYLRGPGFAGMRKVMRQTFDDLWLIDLEGDSRGTRITENVFEIQTPVVIAVGVRYSVPSPDSPAKVHYARITGTADEKLGHLKAIKGLADLHWREALNGWFDPFIPTTDSVYWNWPLLTDIFPWQENGVQFKRNWPIGETLELLERRWAALVSQSGTDQRLALKESEARTIERAYKPLSGTEKRTAPLNTLKADSPSVPPVKYAFRSFDRRFALLDIRLCDRPRRQLYAAHGPEQLYLTSLLTEVLGEGPSATATALIPDLHHFRGSFGGRHIIPLWRDITATEPNITSGILSTLEQIFQTTVSPISLFSYSYAVLFAPEYVKTFWEELTTPGPRVPLTKERALFEKAALLGKKLIWLHTFGERLVPDGVTPGTIPGGKARCKVGTPTTPDNYPKEYSFNGATKELHIGAGVFEHVEPEIWDFSISGFHVLQSWLAFRMQKGAGKKSSPLDRFRPNVWQFDDELLKLLWIIEATLGMIPELDAIVSEIRASAVFSAGDLPTPTAEERASRSETDDEDSEPSVQMSLSDAE